MACRYWACVEMLEIKRQELDQIRSIVSKGVTVISVRQAEAKGLGHAINYARSVVGVNPFAVLLPDVLVDQYRSDIATDNLAAMVKRFEETGNSQIMVEAITQQEVDKYGVVECNGQPLLKGKPLKLRAW